MAGKDFRAAFSNMNQAVRPGNEQPAGRPSRYPEQGLRR